MIHTLESVAKLYIEGNEAMDRSDLVALVRLGAVLKEYRKDPEFAKLENELFDKLKAMLPKRVHNEDFRR